MRNERACHGKYPDRRGAFACTLKSGEFKERLAWIVELNRLALLSTRRDGLRLILTYRQDCAESVREMVRREQQCCAFLGFSLTQDRDRVTLSIEAPREGADALDAIFAPFLAASRQKASCRCSTASTRTGATNDGGDVKPATWHWFAIKGDDPRPLFAFPGIWRRYKGPAKKDGPNIDIETYSFLTTTPNPLVATINHERMPVLLTLEEEFETWLRGSSDEAFALAREYPAEQMRIVQEGLDKENLLRAA